MNLLDKILGAMKDDKGMFQGGKYGRAGGQFLDATDKQQYAHKTPIGEKPNYNSMRPYNITPSQAMNLESIPTQDSFSPKLQKMMEAFDPASGEAVLDLQRQINNSGIRKEPLVEDGKFGKKTFKAVQEMQMQDPQSKEKSITSNWRRPKN